MKRLLSLIVIGYVLTALFTRVLEALGVYQCACDSDCWCKRPGLSVFRWVFPRLHKIPQALGQKRDA